MAPPFVSIAVPMRKLSNIYWTLVPWPISYGKRQALDVKEDADLRMKSRTQFVSGIRTLARVKSSIIYGD